MTRDEVRQTSVGPVLKPDKQLVCAVLATVLEETGIQLDHRSLEQVYLKSDFDEVIDSP